MKFILLCLLPLIGAAQTLPKKVDLDQAAYKIIHAGEKPDFMSIWQDKAWVVDDHQNRIFKISPESKTPLLTVTIPEAGTLPVIGFNAVWVMSCTERKLYKIDFFTGKILAVIATGMADTNGEMSLSVGDGSVWLMADSSGILMRINPATNAIQKKIAVKPNSYGTAYGHNAIWVSNYLASSVQRIDTKTNTVIATIHVGKNPRFITSDETGVWTLNQGDGTVSRIDPLTNKPVANIDVKAKGSGGDIVAGSGKVWVVSTNPERPVQLINQATNSIEIIYSQKATPGKVFKVDGAARISENYIWISGYHSKKIWILKR